MNKYLLQVKVGRYWQNGINRYNRESAEREVERLEKAGYETRIVFLGDTVEAKRSVELFDLVFLSAFGIMVTVIMLL